MLATLLVKRWRKLRTSDDVSLYHSLARTVKLYSRAEFLRDSRHFSVSFVRRDGKLNSDSRAVTPINIQFNSFKYFRVDINDVVNKFGYN
jgi:hypothetical protein